MIIEILCASKVNLARSFNILCFSKVYSARVFNIICGSTVNLARLFNIPCASKVNSARFFNTEFTMSILALSKHWRRAGTNSAADLKQIYTDYIGYICKHNIN